MIRNNLSQLFILIWTDSFTSFKTKKSLVSYHILPSWLECLRNSTRPFMKVLIISFCLFLCPTDIPASLTFISRSYLCKRTSCFQIEISLQLPSSTFYKLFSPHVNCVKSIDLLKRNQSLLHRVNNCFLEWVVGSRNCVLKSYTKPTGLFTHRSDMIEKLSLVRCLLPCLWELSVYSS